MLRLNLHDDITTNFYPFSGDYKSLFKEFFWGGGEQNRAFLWIFLGNFSSLQYCNMNMNMNTQIENIVSKIGLAYSMDQLGPQSLKNIFTYNSYLIYDG